MIIRSEPGALLFITQPDHATLAADLVVHFTGFAAHPRRDDIQLAVLEHDNGWQPLDEDLVFDAAAGRALDFMTVPEPVKRSVWPTGIDRLAVLSPYAAALVAEHALFVYSANRGAPDWQAFFQDLARRRDDLLTRSGVTQAVCSVDYRFLALADLLSLSFCSGWADSRERFGHRVRCVDQAVTIAPPLLAAPAAARVRARRVVDRPYESAGALRTALAEAPAEWITGIARGAAE